MKMLRCFLYVKLTDYLNGLKKVLLHSHTTKLPNLIIEAMACDTPILATPLGAIPGMIEDGKTGFIMENNSPACIAENIIRALGYPNLDEIVKSSRRLVKEGFTYEAAVKKYKKILVRRDLTDI
jgi:glycosyltransferase involved in cell wall biosynthesis